MIYIHKDRQPSTYNGVKANMHSVETIRWDLIFAQATDMQYGPLSGDAE